MSDLERAAKRVGETGRKARKAREEFESAIADYMTVAQQEMQNMNTTVTPTGK